ncbi:MAG: MBL fold metallo-hydrolase [Candidatus Lokiarchaeota archaeon]|nr:MBL fold metallo-hydrolase [Candidatus Lokiarchaeota archaeon]
MNYKKIDFESSYFDLFELTDGIHVAISKNDSEVKTSSGIFDLGNYLIIFDTFMYPGGARDLYKAVKELYDRDPSFIINSHYHSDHVFGNCLFPDNIPIISTPITVKKIEEDVSDQLKEFRKTAEEEIQRRKEMLNSDDAPFGEVEIHNDIEFYKYITNPDFKIRLPNFLINNNLTIKGTKRTLQLIPYGVGHTDSDIVAYFPNEKICFMGDLLLANLDDSWAPNDSGRFSAFNPSKLYEILKSIIEKDIEIYIAGHGGISTEESVQMNMDFIKKYYLKN